MTGCGAVRGGAGTATGVSAPCGTIGAMADSDLPERPSGSPSPERSPQSPPPPPASLPDYADRVLNVAELIPPGRVMTYGDIAAWLREEGVAQGGPRQVGQVMARYGGAVPWWRVVRADGVPLPGHERQALARYRAEGTPLRQAGAAARGAVLRIDVRRARWDGRPVGRRRAEAPGEGATD